MSAPTESPSTSSPHESGTSCWTHRKFRLSCDDFEELWERSGGRCECCGKPFGETATRRPFIDHDHRYGLRAVRGLLCGRCNTYLGLAETKAGQPLLAQYLHGIPFVPYLQSAWFARHVQTHQNAEEHQEAVRAEMARLKAGRQLGMISIPTDDPRWVADSLWIALSPENIAIVVEILGDHLSQED